MFSLKKLLIVIVSIALLIIIGQQYHNVPLSNRMIILGIGIDEVENGYNITVESATFASSSPEAQSSVGSKVFTVFGQTIGLAIRQVFNESGHIPSLGQCNIIIIGEDTAKNSDISGLLSFFSFSDAFKDGTVIASCKGSAEKLLNYQVPFDSSICDALQNTLLTQSKKTGKIPLNLLDFLIAQASQTQDTFLPYVEFREMPGNQVKNADNSDLTGGVFDYNKILLISKGRYKTTLDSVQTSGASILLEKNIFHRFIITETLKKNYFPTISGVGSIKTKVEFQPSFLVNGKVQENLSAVLFDKPTPSTDTVIPYMNISINMEVKRLKTDDIGESIWLSPKTKTGIRSDKSLELQNSVINIVSQAIDVEKSFKCDYLNFYSEFYQKLGNDWLAYSKLYPNWTENISYSVNCDITLE